MVGPSIGIFLLCILPCVFENFHVRFIYVACTHNLHGTFNRRKKAYQAKYSICQRLLLKPLLARPFEKIFVYLFIQNYIFVLLTVATLTVFVLEQILKFTFFCENLFVIMMIVYGVYLQVSIAIQLETGRRLA